MKDNNPEELSQPAILDDIPDVIDWNWRSGRDCVGFVAIWVTRNVQWCAYVGVADGRDEKADIIKIRKWGARLTQQEALGFFPELGMYRYGTE